MSLKSEDLNRVYDKIDDISQMVAQNHLELTKTINKNNIATTKRINEVEKKAINNTWRNRVIFIVLALSGGASAPKVMSILKGFL